MTPPNRQRLSTGAFGEWRGRTELKGYSSATFDAYERGRRYARPVNREIVRWALDAHAGDADWILDLGSGLGELAGLLSADLRARVVQSDALAELLAQNVQDTPKIVADAYTLPFANDAIPSVACYAFLNAITGVEAAAQEAARVLCPGGALVSILDVQAAPELLMARFPTDLLLPAAMPVPDTDVVITDRMYLRTDRTLFVRALASSAASLAPPVRDFLHRYLRAPDQGWYAFQTEGTHQSRVDQAYAIAEALPGLGAAFQMIDSLRHVERLAQAACWQAGLRVVQSELVTGHGEVARNETPGFPQGKNVAFANMGASWFDIDPGVPEGQVHLASTLHVLAAIKPFGGGDRTK